MGIWLSFHGSPDTIKEWIKNFIAVFVIFHIVTMVVVGLYLGLPMFYHWLGTLG